MVDDSGGGRGWRQAQVLLEPAGRAIHPAAAVDAVRVAFVEQVLFAPGRLRLSQQPQHDAMKQGDADGQEVSWLKAGWRQGGAVSTHADAGRRTGLWMI